MSKLKINKKNWWVKFLNIFIFLNLGAYGYTLKNAPQTHHYPVIPNMNSMILLQQTPQNNTVYREFYANNVELEPLTLIMCGRPVENKDETVTFKKVDPKQVYNIRFYANSMLTLDQRYNPHNTIPVLHNADVNLFDEKGNPKPYDYPYWTQNDLNEPLISKVDASKRKILLLYDETSNYYNLYRKEGFYLGGTFSGTRYSYSNGHGDKIKKGNFSRKRFITYDDSANKCFPDQAPGVGETVVRIYLLGTKSLNNSPTVNIYAEAGALLPKDNSDPENPIPAHYETITEGPMTYRIPQTPALETSSLDPGELNPDGHFKNPYEQFGLFSAQYEEQDGTTVEEQEALPVCSYVLGSPFHNLFEHSDLRQDAVRKRECSRTVGKATSEGCKTVTCSKKVKLSTLKLNTIALHDMYVSTLKSGAKCSVPNGLYPGAYNIKPLLRSEATVRHKKDVDSFYRSLLGGVGAFYYVKSIGHNQFKKLSTGVVGGESHTFYLYSYTWGTAPKPGIACDLNDPITASGHDMYGNNVSVEFVPAIGKTTTSIKSVSR